jgi:GntR family transcriptional regulator
MRLPRKPVARSRAKVDSRHPTPLYHQIYLILRDQIGSGNYAADDFLPTEHELIRQYDVSRITAKRALDELAADGFAVRMRGRGTRVQRSNPVPPVHAPIEGLLENILAIGLKTEVELLEFDYLPAAPHVAAALECKVGETVQRAVRLRRIKGEPFSHLVTYVPESIGRSYSRRDLASHPLLLLLERAGASISHAEQVIGASLAGTDVADLLGVPIGAALLKLSRTVYDQDGRAVEFVTGLYRPDRYQYKMTLSRIPGRGRKLWSAVHDFPESKNSLKALDG